MNPNSLMREEIARRIDQIPYMHKEQLLDNLLWLSGQGEQVIPQLLDALKHSEPKVRSSATWCLGWMGDKRAIPPLQELAERETDEVVRLEVARQLLALGDMGRVSHLIAGLESDRRHVRYLCYEALKGQTGQDFGYDHRVEDASERAPAVARWRDWWSDMNSDRMLRPPKNLAQPPAQPPRGDGEARVPPAPGDSGGRQPSRHSSGQPSTSAQPQDSSPQSSQAGTQQQATTQPATQPATQPSSRPTGNAEFEFK